jgi:hydrogenase maturation protease
MARVLIVCYGNPLRCDDALGWRAAEELEKQVFGPEIEVLACHQLTIDLASTISTADAVFFIDATRDGEPGELTCNPVSPANMTAGLTHSLTPAAVLSLSAQLYGAVPRAFEFTVCGECFDHGEKLSARVESRLPQLTAIVTRAAKLNAIGKP